MAKVFTQNGYLHITYMIFDENKNKKVRKKKSTGLIDTEDNRKYVEKDILPDIEKKLESGELVVTKRIPTVSELAKEFIEAKYKEDVRKYTVSDYDSALKQHVFPIFGDKPINIITVDDIENWLRDLMKIYSASRIKNIKIPFNQVFKKAIKKNLIDDNPFDRSDVVIKKSQTKDKDKNKDKKKRNKNKIDPFSKKEIMQLIKSAEGQLRNYIAIAFFTGMRPSEQIFLTWDKVCFTKRAIWVDGAITGKETDFERDLTKSISSYREIKLSSQALHYFKEQYKLTKSDNGAVFLNQYGKQYSSAQTIRDKHWKNLLEKTAIRKRRLYDLRHSFASINLSDKENGLPLAYISYQLGHSDIEVTLKEYSAFIADDDTKLFSMLDKAFDESWNISDEEV